MHENLTLLLLHNDAEQIQLVDKLCSELDFDLQLFSTAEAALAYMQKNTVDLIFVDEFLPDSSGYEFCNDAHLLPALRYCPVLMLAAETHHESISKAMEVGVTDIFLSSQEEEISIYLRRFSHQRQAVNGRVLLVEDSLSLQRAATAALKTLGLVVVCASDVDTAWYYFQEQKFDLAIVDLVLEGDASGQVLINRIRRLQDGSGDLPIMVMSSYDDEARRVQLYRSGVTEFLHKPVAYEELIVRARQLVLGWQLQGQVRQQKDELQELNSSLQKFLGRVSHECRNAINVAMGSAKRLLKRREYDPRTQQQLQIIVNASEHQLSLVNDIIDYSQLETGHLKLNTSRFTLTELIDEVIGLFKLRCDDLGLYIDSRIASEVPGHIVADRRRLQQVLMNLIGNALKFTRDGGITVEVDIDSQESQLHFQVRDTGTGIDEAEQADLFQAFTQTKTGRESALGTGLGLAICAEFALLMNGSMAVTSELNKGSCFTLTIPLSE